MTCAHCAELEAQLADLRQELGYEVDQQLVDAFRSDHGLTGQEAILVAALCRANGRVLTRAALAGLLPKLDGVERDSDQIIACFVMRVRMKLGDAVIETIWGRGYRASDALRQTFGKRPAEVAA